MRRLKIYIKKVIILLRAILQGENKVSCLTDNETFGKILNGSSISRFGDGELVYIYGFHHMWQKEDVRLRLKLRSIFNLKYDALLVAVPDFLINTKIRRKNINAQGWRLPKYCLRLLTKPKEVYGSSFIFRPINSISEKDKLLIDKILAFINSRNSVYVGTNESYKNYIKPLFVYNDIPETNAFSCCYNKILSDVVTMCKGIDSPLIVITCGITGTVLSADFSKHGIQALDIGSFFEQISALHHQK